ncbi:MAG: sensor histidine kinase, partial [Desulfotignum sp.]
TDLNQTIDDVLTLLTYEIKKHQVHISKDFHELPLPEVDANKFKQIFINLILNAIQAMEPQGTIHISTRCTPESLFIHIADNGPGIPDHIKEQIFEPFFTKRKDATGTGLGLYLCRKIITA